jgi:hypothetical protein
MALTVAQVDAAITSILTDGQKYVIGDREYTQADLEDLIALRKTAVSEERTAGKGMFQRVRFGTVGA